MTSHASMNRAYSIVWNDKQQAYVPAPETARRSGRKTNCTVIAAAVATLFTGGLAHALDPGALPGGGVVTAGHAAIGQNGNSMTIQQASGKVAIDWQSFSVGSNAQVNFVQPSANAIALNRVVGQDASQILGAMHANGQVFILNPNGVLFAPGAQVSAAGVLASTRAISNEDFMAGKLNFSGSGAGTVVNEGSITAASGGYVVLVGAQVRNSGAIVAQQGDVHLAAANQVSLQIAGAGLTAFAVDQGTLDALAENRGLIKADGGRIFLTADALNQLAKATVNNTGVIEAHTVENRNGSIVLKGDLQRGTAQVGGTLDASAPNGGDGGFIETSAAHLQAAPTLRVSTQSAGGKTGTWLIDPVDFTIAASGGDMTGAQLSTNLAGNNVTIQSTSGTQGTAGDIHVNDVVTWSTNKLTLNAQNNININANLNGSAGALLALEYGQGAVASGNTSTYNLASGAKVSMPEGNTFSAKRGSDGTTTNFYVINSLGAEGSSTTTDLQGMRANVTGNYALGADIDASATSTWQSGQGFTFIGTQGNVYSGNFEGLGHTIDGLFENWAVGYIGLFGKIDTTARIGNVHLTNVNISGKLDNVGGLVGYASKSSVIEHVSVQGKINGGNNNVGGLIGFNDGKVNDAHANNVSVTGKNYATGGLIGKQSTNGVTTLSDSSGTIKGFYDVGGLIGSSSTALVGLHSSATVTPTGGESGGLVGRASGAISNSYATGNISSVNGDMIGGLVGQADGAITDSYATGNVAGGGGYTGGLAGKANGNITNTYATGKVDGAHLVGGLVGYQKFNTLVSDSYATGMVTGTLYSVGGLIGSMGGSVSKSYATGNVKSATDAVGGLIGSWSSGNSPEVKDSYATGTVDGRYAVGGLIGDTSGCFCAVKSSHATGKVTGTADYVGGLIGYVDVATITDSYATGNVSGINNVGGLVGQGVDITNSYATGSVGGETNIGGLVGLEKMGGTVTSASYASGNVTGTLEAAGGLVGRNEGTVKGASYSTSLVVGTKSVGGLVGGNYGEVSDARTGNNGTPGPVVTGATGTGGLIGYNSASGVVSKVQATGDVKGSSDYTGGLIGFNDKGGTVSSSKASGTVTGTGAVGGLIGENDGSLTSSVFDTGTVNGVDAVGGLVGYNAGSIGSVSYTKQAVTGTGNAVGGLVGENAGAIGGASYANGVVKGVDQVGGLVGLNSGGSLYSVSADIGTVSGHDQVGGLVGLLSNGTVTQATAAGAVDGNTEVGGFVGAVSKGAYIYTSKASGAVTAVSVAGGFVGKNASTIWGSLDVSDGVATSSSVSVTSGQAGGFAGSNIGTLTEVLANNNLTINGAVQDVGGIVGVNSGTVELSNAVNTVQAGNADNVGGLVGRNTSTGIVTKSYATNNVTGHDATGGLVGANDGSITIAYAGGSVGGHDNVGGLIGKQGSTGSASNVYATAATSGNAQVGGLIGAGNGTVSYAYASGAVTGSGANVGGLLGNKTGGTVSNSFFDLDGTAQAHSSGDFGTNGEVAVGKTSDQMKTTATFAGWDLSATGSHDKIWRMYEGQARPLLTYWLTPLTISGTMGGPETHVYDGTVRTIAATGITYTETLPAGHLLGSAPVLSGKNVGVYNNATGFYSDQQGYDLTAPNGSLTITPATLTATATATSRAYDGTTAAQLGVGGITLSGLVAGESATSVAKNGTYNSKNVATASTVNYGILGAGDFVAANGTLLSNYTLPEAALTGAGTITAKLLTVTGTALDKVYDGNTVAQITLTSNSIINGDDILLSGSGHFVNKNAGSGKAVTITDLSKSGTDAGNYSLPGGSVGTTASIIARVLSEVTATAADKVYDGNTNAQTSVSAGNVVEGDQLQLSGNGSFVDKNVGNGKTVQISGVQTSGQDAGNYVYESGNLTAMAAITAKSLTATATATSRAYDGTTAAQLGVGGITLGGLVSGESATSVAKDGTYNSKNVATASTVNYGVLGAGDFVAANGTLLSNYTLPDAALTGAGSITAKLLTVTGTALDKVYDGNTVAQITLTSNGVINGDNLLLSGSGHFANKNAGSGKAVTITDLSKSGTDAGNYSLPGDSVGTTASIFARVLSEVTATAADKVYDGNTNAQTSVSAGNVVEGDQLQLSGNGSFVDKNVGNGKTVQISGVQTGGQDAGNYVYNGGDLTATAAITARPLTATLQGTTSKIADGTTSATLNPDNYLVSNVVNGETINIDQPTGEYDNANIGSGKPITVVLENGNYSAGGNTLLSNYQLLTGNVTGNIGIIRLNGTVPGPGSNVDSNNEGRLGGNTGTISFSQGFNGVLAGLPTNTPPTDVGAANITVSVSGSTQVISTGQQESNPLAPAVPSAVSRNTRENLLFRRAFSIGDGGIRLPQGVRGSEKDAPQ